MGEIKLTFVYVIPTHAKWLSEMSFMCQKWRRKLEDRRYCPREKSEKSYPFLSILFFLFIHFISSCNKILFDSGLNMRNKIDHNRVINYIVT